MLLLQQLLQSLQQLLQRLQQQLPEKQLLQLQYCVYASGSDSVHTKLKHVLSLPLSVLFQQLTSVCAITSDGFIYCVFLGFNVSRCYVGGAERDPFSPCSGFYFLGEEFPPNVSSFPQSTMKQHYLKQCFAYLLLLFALMFMLSRHLFIYFQNHSRPTPIKTLRRR